MGRLERHSGYPDTLGRWEMMMAVSKIALCSIGRGEREGGQNRGDLPRDYMIKVRWRQYEYSVMYADLCFVPEGEQIGIGQGPLQSGLVALRDRDHFSRQMVLESLGMPLDGPTAVEEHSPFDRSPPEHAGRMYYGELIPYTCLNDTI